MASASEIIAWASKSRKFRRTRCACSARFAYHARGENMFLFQCKIRILKRAHRFATFSINLLQPRRKANVKIDWEKLINLYLQTLQKCETSKNYRATALRDSWRCRKDFRHFDFFIDTFYFICDFMLWDVKMKLTSYACVLQRGRYMEPNVTFSYSYTWQIRKQRERDCGFMRSHSSTSPTIIYKSQTT